MINYKFSDKQPSGLDMISQQPKAEVNVIQQKIDKTDNYVNNTVSCC